MTCKTIARFAVSAALGTAMLAGMPTIAFADTSAELQAKLDEANSHLDDLYSQASEVGQQLLQTQEDLDSTNQEITKKQGELDDAEDVLAKRVASDYKTGGVSLASIIFDSSSFDDLVSRIYYASKTSQSDAQVIQNVKDIQKDLNDKQAQQQQLLSDQQSQKDEIDAKTSEAESYVQSLDQQVQDKLAEEQAAREAEQKAAQEQAAQQAQADGGYVQAAEDNGGNATTNGSATTNGGGTVTGTTNGTSNQGTSNGGSTGNQAGSNTTQGSASKPKPSGSGSSSSGSSSSSSGSLTAAQRNAIIAAAWSKVGGPYVYGGTGPVGYDCSGFVQYCYAQAGISLPRTSEAQGAVGSRTSNPQPGDIIAWGGHVGIYISDGMMIDAGNERVGISYRAIYGSPWYVSY